MALRRMVNSCLTRNINTRFLSVKTPALLPIHKRLSRYSRQSSCHSPISPPRDLRAASEHRHARSARSGEGSVRLPDRVEAPMDRIARLVALAALALMPTAVLAADASLSGSSIRSDANFWQGPYVGANLGHQWSRVSNSAAKPSGIAGGVQAGYNWQTRHSCSAPKRTSRAAAPMTGSRLGNSPIPGSARCGDAPASRWALCCSMELSASPTELCGRKAC